jgi:hypothetical protein
MSLKAVALIGLAILAFASGVCGQLLYPRVEVAPSEIYFIFGSTLLVFVWYRVDSDEAGYRRSIWLNVSVLAVSLVALPYYFFRSRGARRGALATLAFFSLAILWGVLVAAGQYAAWYGVQS